MANFIAAIDQGTTSTRCIVFNHEGSIVAAAQMEHRQIFPKPGWVEHNPLEILNNAVTVFKSALQKSGLKYSDIHSIGITNQRETVVLWDKTTGLPLSNAIVWQDTRSADICDSLSKKGGIDRFREKVGLPIATYFSGPKIKWLKDNIVEVDEAIKSKKALFGNIDSWLIWNLTGGIKGGVLVTDVSNASRTFLMNIQDLQWDESILSELNISQEIMPKIVSSSEVYGYAQSLGDIPIAGDLGDQQAALFGQTCFQTGDAKNTYGTGCFMLMNAGEKPMQSKAGLLTTLGYQVGSNKPIYCLEGSIAITGALVQWIRDNLKIIEKSADIEPLARTVEDNGGIYFVPAFSGLFAPYWRSDARGALVGMTRYINRGHIARAVLEATAFQTKEVLEAMESDSGVKLKSLRVDGGMVFNELLMQFQADILNVPVVRPKVSETTALGAAYAAGLATGYWKDMSDLKKNYGIDKEWQPSMEKEAREELYSKWKKAVTRTFDWI